MTDIKECTKCKEVKPTSDFYKNRAAKDGLQCRCKDCQNSAVKANATKEKTNAYAAKWRARNRSVINERAREASKKKYLENPEKFKDKAKEWRDKNIERARETSKKFRENNPGYAKEYNAKYYKKNSDSIKEAVASYRMSNSEKLRPIDRERAMRRVSKKKNATPSWANRNAIKEIYKTADRLTRSSGVAHEVDHIVPLQSDRVCGLHCESNLAIIESVLNKSKGNRFWPDCPDDIEQSYGDEISMLCAKSLPYHKV